jgi:hypothetical protein
MNDNGEQMVNHKGTKDTKNDHKERQNQLVVVLC